jgi:hypothetical protein
VENKHLGWITAWGAVTGVFAALAIGYWLIAADSSSRLPWWPLVPFGFAVVAGVYMIFAPVGHWWPFESHPRPKGSIHPRPVRSKPEPQFRVLHPWITDRQLVITLQKEGSTAANPAEIPIGLICEVHRQGATTVARNVPTYPAHWKVVTHYPQDFPGASALSPGEYEVRWFLQHFDMTAARPFTPAFRTILDSRHFQVVKEEGRLRVRL